MNRPLGKLVGLHQAFWTYDPWYRRAWFIGPQALSLMALALLLVPGHTPPPAAQWAKPVAPQPPQASADQQLCMNDAAEFKQRGEACDRLIRLGKLAGSELAGAYFGRGWMKWNTNQPGPAIADYSEAVKHNPNHHVAYNNRGALYLYSNNDLPNALRDFSEAIRIDPKFALALANRAEVLRRQGKLPEALADANKAIEIDQKHARALSVRDAIQADVRRIEEEKARTAQASADHQLCMNISADVKQRGEACDRLINLGKLTGSELAEAYFGRGWMRWNANQIEPAIADYSEAIKHNPNGYLGYNNRGAIYLDRNDLPNALRDFNEAIRNNQSNALAFANRAEALRRQGKLSEALADANRAIEIDQKLAFAVSVRNAIQADLKRIEEEKAKTAQASADQQLCTNPGDVKLRGEACDRLITLGKLAGTELAEAYFGRGLMRRNAEQVETAIADYSEAIKLNHPNSHWAYNNRGAIYLAKNDLPNALRDFGEAIRIDRDTRSPSPTGPKCCADRTSCRRRSPPSTRRSRSTKSTPSPSAFAMPFRLMSSAPRTRAISRRRRPKAGRSPRPIPHWPFAPVHRPMSRSATIPAPSPISPS